MSDLRFPVFIDLNGKTVAVIGGGTIATRRVQRLLIFGAEVFVIAPEVSAELRALDGEKLTWLKGSYNEQQNLKYWFDKRKEPVLVFAATNSPDANEAVRQECMARSIPANIASNQKMCDFFFPGVVIQDEVVVGLTACGKDHAKAKHVSETLHREMAVIRVGSRESRLAVIQAEMVMDYLKKRLPLAKVELVTMKTTGDKILDRTLDQIGGKGLFVKELDRALLEHRTDLSVHSLKDMPMEVPEELPLLGFSRREDPRDVLVLPEGESDWNMSRPVGCSSRRRMVQLKRLYPQLEFQPVRGNVLTRLNKLDRGEYGALILAAAGLKRLGLGHRISRYFSPEEMIPAAGQGVLAIQGRSGEDYSYLDEYFDDNAAAEALAERAFVKTLDGGCSSPIAAHALAVRDQLTLRGLYYSEEKKDFVTGEVTGSCADAEQLGEKLAQELKERLDG